jgi:(p)ppGpp synthase/HD superfamily hydrolase
MNIKNKMSRKSLSIAIISLFAINVSSFSLKAKRTRTEMSSVLFYRSSDDSVASVIQPENLTASTLVKNPLLNHARMAEVFSKMPPWLRIQRSHVMERNIDNLKETMRQLFYTEKEISKLIFAIDEASLGNRNMMSGAAEFCLILTETMEMGLNALIAAAFHFCASVKAREESVMSTCVSFGVWDSKEHKGLKMFGNHVVEIARDAARLKKMEMVFGSIVQNPSSSVRLSLDSKDADNLRKLLLTNTQDWRALAIRSAACLFRLRGIEMQCGKNLTSEAIRASREALYIYAPLASRLGMHRLKNELEGAAFRTLYRRQYNTVVTMTEQNSNLSREPSNVMTRGGSTIGYNMKRVLESVQKEMEQVLASDPVFSATTQDFHVAARLKEPYSLWRKMLRNKCNHVLQVPDALALRIVLNAKKSCPSEPQEVTSARERALCYYAQQLCKNNWAPLKGNPRFKDYIERPKPNGYQSLHYTAMAEFQNENWTLEIQIRSGEMHKVAEFGLASHWDYKSNSKTCGKQSPFYTTDAYLRSVQEWHWEQQPSRTMNWSAQPVSEESEMIVEDVNCILRAQQIEKRTKRLNPYLEALNAAQSDLVRDHVFVFLSQSDDTLNCQGKIISLPSGACVLDALRQGERTSGLSVDWRGSPSLNGRETNLTSQLRNGDILTLPSTSAANVFL